MGKKMFVGGLPYEVDEPKLRELFSPYGMVVGAKVIIDRETGRSKGFGFVEMSTEQEAQIATQKLNNSLVGERKIFVNEARPMEPRVPGRPAPQRSTVADRPIFDGAKMDGGYGGKRRGHDPRRKNGGRKYGDEDGNFGGGKKDFGSRKSEKRGRDDFGDDDGRW